jgi:hypothetical protein
MIHESKMTIMDLVMIIKGDIYTGAVHDECKGDNYELVRLTKEGTYKPCHDKQRWQSWN